MTELINVSEPRFSATVVHDGDEIVVALAGSADIAAKNHLGRVFGDLHERAREANAARVKVDLRGLSFMNSSCFKDVIGWLDNVRTCVSYRVVFVSSAAHAWQHRSLRVLSRFARDLVTVEAAQ